MSKKEHQYQLKEKIGEDSKTRSYLAVDLRLKRPVTFIHLKKNHEESESRHFLLQARSLGQLQHPGLLPLYDMGLNNDRYFYTHRMPPGRPLSELISKEGPSLGRSQQFTQTLIRLSDTLDYLHRNRVTLERFTAKDISIGSFGEVVLHNLSLATHHRQASDEGPLIEGKHSDMKNLAELGLRMWLGSPRTDEILIRDWDFMAQKLPIELQEIFDRAFLERGGKYPDPAHFSQDLLNFQQGLPPEHRRDDLLFRMKGFLFKRKKESLALLLSLLLCFFLILSKTHPIQTITKHLEELHQIRNQQAQTLASMDSNLDELEAAVASGEDELKNLDEKLVKQKAQFNAMKNLQNEAENLRSALENQRELLTDKKTELLKKEEEWLRKSESWDRRIQKQSEAIARRGEQLMNLESTPTQPFSIVELRNNPKALLAYVDALDLENGWLTNYLGNISDSEEETSSILVPLDGELSQITEDPNSNRLLLLHDSFTLLDLNSLQHNSYPLPRKNMSNVFFSPRENYFYGQDDRSLIIFTPLSLLRSIPILVDSHNFKLLPNGSMRQIHAWDGSLYFSGGLSRDIGIPPTYNPVSIAMEEGTLDILSSGDGRYWNLHEKGVSLLPLQNGVLSLEKPPNHWFSQFKDGLALIIDQELCLYPWPSEFENMAPPTRYKIPPEFIPPDEVVGDLSEQQIWLRKGDSYLYFSPSNPDPLVRKDLKGQLVWWSPPNLFTAVPDQLFITKLSAPSKVREEAPTDLSEQHLQDWRETPPPGMEFRGGWESPEDSLVLVLNGNRSIEVWSRATWSKVGHLALAKEDLKSITYRKKDHTILGLSQKGEWLKF